MRTTTQTQTATAVAGPGHVVEARDVHLSFGATPALRGVNVVVKSGEILAVMGPSGSGKSSLLHCLAGILVPESGEILFGGRRIDTLAEEARSTLRRDHFGFVFQFGQLVPELTAEENVALPLLLGGTRRAEALHEARAWFERLDLAGLERRRSGELSGGQAQRVALARGLVSRPEVLFADEPTGSLDSFTGEQVMNLLVTASRQQGTTVVLVTHDPRVAAYADREIVVRDGKASSLSPDRAVMIRLGLRLTIHAGKEATVRLLITAAAVALGVGLLFVALAGMNALTAQNARTAWLNTGIFGQGPPPGTPAPVGGPSISLPNAPATGTPLWWLFNQDYFGNKMIDQIDVAATGTGSPLPPGLAELPGPGQFYASPALSRLLRDTPAAELGDRFPGRQVGTIGPAALPSPNSLIIVVGQTPEQLSTAPGASLVTSINTNSHADGLNGWDANKLQTILAVGALALLFPVLIFIATATRLSAARREQRFAAMRLVGATPRQVSVLSAVESSVAALAGVAVGFVVFLALRPALASVPFTGAPFAPGDLSLGVFDVALVVIGVPLAAVVAARIAMRRVQISPLGVTRRVTPAPPRAYRLLPLLAGIAELAYFVEVGRPKSTGGQIEAYFSGCLLMMAGLVIAGPWLTMVGSRLIVGRTSRADVLIAGRRLSDNPRAAFRAISGLIIALFATSVSVGIISTVLADNAGGVSGQASGATLVDRFGTDFGPQSPDGQSVSSPSVPATLIAGLQSIPGVRGVTELFADPNQNQVNDNPTFLVSCRQLAATPALGRCAPGAEVAVITGTIDRPAGHTKSTLARSIWPSAPIAASGLTAASPQAVVVATTGSTSAIEQARTTLEKDFPQGSALTLSEINAISNRSIEELQQLTKVVIIVSLVIAGCSLAVSVTGGVNDRKRPFSLLRLTGVPVKALRRVVAFEAAVPLLVIAVPSAGMGFLAAALFLRSQLSESLRPPGSGYYVIVVAGLLASLAIIGSTLPLIDRITGPEIARNE